MKMPIMKMLNITNFWKGLPSDYKVFIIVATIFLLLSPGMIVEIDEPTDILHIITDEMGHKHELPMEILSLIQLIGNKLTFNSINELKMKDSDFKNLGRITPVLVHSVVAGLIATFLLKV